MTILALKEMRRRRLVLWIPVVLDHVFVRVHPVQFRCQTLIPSVMVSGGGALGRWLGPKGGALTMRLMLL